MENKELLQKLNFLIKEINETHNRLQRANENFQEIETALITRQIVNLYQHLQRLQDSYRKARLQGAVIAQSPVKENTIQKEMPAIQKTESQTSASNNLTNQPLSATEPVKQQQPTANNISKNNEQEIRTEPTPIHSEPKQAATNIQEVKSQYTPPVSAPEPVKPAFNFSTSSSRIETSVPGNNSIQPSQSEEKANNNFIKKDEKTEETKQTQPEPVNFLSPQPQSEPIPEQIIPTQNQTAPEKQEASLNERHNPESQSINERFAQNHVKKNLADKLKLSPIKDVKAAMSLSQRISFIKNLFKGNDEDFTKTISFINNLKNFNEAKFYIQSEVSNKFSWEQENPLVQEFMELVYRKFL